MANIQPPLAVSDFGVASKLFGIGMTSPSIWFNLTSNFSMVPRDELEVDDLQVTEYSRAPGFINDVPGLARAPTQARDSPPGITGRKAPGFINDVPGLALAPTQARDSPGPWSLDEDTSSCSGVDSMGSEQPLSDLGDGSFDRIKRPRSS